MDRDGRYDYETGQIDPHYPVAWDSTCTLIALLEQPPASHAPPTPSTPSTSSPTVHPAPSSNDASVPSSPIPTPAKRLKLDDADAKADPTSSSPPRSEWEEYRPWVLGTFSLDLTQLDTSPPLRYTSTLTPRILTPGIPPLYREPTLPLRMRPPPPSGRRVRVIKPPVSTLLHVAHRHHLLQAGAPLPGCDGLTFVAFRHSLQCMLDGRSSTWRVDVQRWGRVVLIRRYLDYSWQEPADFGHQFEAACTEGGGEGGFRVLVAGHVGRHSLVTSCEVDAVAPPLPAEGAPLHAAQLMELKTVMADVAGRKLKEKQRGWWMQAWLGGVGSVQMGMKVRLEGGEVEVREVREVKVDGMVGEAEKAKVTGKLRALLQLLEERVVEGRLYKLVREKRSVQEGHQVALYEVVGGMDSWPVWKEQGVESAKAVAEEDRQPEVGAERPIGEDEKQLMEGAQKEGEKEEEERSLPMQQAT